MKSNYDCVKQQMQFYDIQFLSLKSWRLKLITYNICTFVPKPAFKSQDDDGSVDRCKFYIARDSDLDVFCIVAEHAAQLFFDLSQRYVYVVFGQDQCLHAGDGVVCASVRDK